jgi:putative NADH-flavin reductase
MEDRDISEMIDRLNKWLDTPEAQEALKQAAKKARETVEKLQESRKINWLDLHRPMDI